MYTLGSARAIGDMYSNTSYMEAIEKVQKYEVHLTYQISNIL